MKIRTAQPLLSYRVTLLVGFLILALSSAAAINFRPSIISDLSPFAPSPLDFEALLSTAKSAQPISTDSLREGAAAVTASLLRAYPKSPSAHHIAATYAARIRQYDQAIDLWHTALQLDPTFVVARTAAADALLQRGDADAARQMLLGDPDNNGPARTVYGCLLLVQSWEMSGDVPQATRSCDDALVRFPANPLLLLERARLALEANDLQTAATRLQDVLVKAPTLAEAHRLLANVAAREGKKEEHTRLLDAYERLQDQKSTSDERFQETYDKVLLETVYELYVLTAEEHTHHGHFVEARNLLREAIILNYTNVEAMRCLVKNLLLLEQPADAYLVQRYLSENHPSIAALRNLAAIAVQLNRLDDAINALTQALRLDPRSEKTLKSLVIVARQAQNARLMTYYAEVLAEASPSSENYRTLAEAYRYSGDSDGYNAALARSAPPSPR